MTSAHSLWYNCLLGREELGYFYIKDENLVRVQTYPDWVGGVRVTREKLPSPILTFKGFFMKVVCAKCKSVIESKHRHDFVWCSCKSIAIDGGNAYTKLVGNPEDILNEEGVAFLLEKQ